MSSSVIQRQYDEVIAEHYDVDPLSVINDALNQALEHVRRAVPLDAGQPPLSALDLGIGTGLFIEKLQAASGRKVCPYGLDISERMIDIARRRIPGLNATVEDAASVEHVFGEESFDLICTHFITGFVPIRHLAPRIFARLKPGGCWSFVGVTSAAYPKLRHTAQSMLVRLIFSKRRRLDLSGLITPDDAAAVVGVFAEQGLEVCSVETFEPKLDFKNFDEFMAFGYRGGWLTPFIEDLGLHKAKPSVRRLLNTFVFPISDHHKIAIGLARKPPILDETEPP
ncbi:MAG TPA: class I SAM-dependent methyltransferase [Pirellulales bacterium]|nr:class I SAM-dependent methyltransferase [Pirellulales bacterium]